MQTSWCISIPGPTQHIGYEVNQNTARTWSIIDADTHNSIFLSRAQLHRSKGMTRSTTLTQNHFLRSHLARSRCSVALECLSVFRGCLTIARWSLDKPYDVDRKPRRMPNGSASRVYKNKSLLAITIKLQIHHFTIVPHNTLSHIALSHHHNVR